MIDGPTEEVMKLDLNDPQWSVIVIPLLRQ